MYDFDPSPPDSYYEPEPNFDYDPSPPDSYYEPEPNFDYDPSPPDSYYDPEPNFDYDPSPDDNYYQRNNFLNVNQRYGMGDNLPRENFQNQEQIPIWVQVLVGCLFFIYIIGTICSG